MISGLFFRVLYNKRRSILKIDNRVYKLFMTYVMEKCDEFRRENKLKKYEYKCVSIFGLGEKTTRMLNAYGQEGWELVSVYWAWHYFKREIN